MYRDKIRTQALALAVGASGGKKTAAEIVAMAETFARFLNAIVRGNCGEYIPDLCAACGEGPCPVAVKRAERARAGERVQYKKRIPLPKKTAKATSKNKPKKRPRRAARRNR